MKRYPISNFYVGKLNIGFNMGNLVVPPVLTQHDYEQSELEYTTLSNGAIDIRKIAFDDLTDLEKRIRYESIFTIFYKHDDNNYACLHNGNIYHLSGENYCSDLVPLSSCVPQVAGKVPREITYNGAVKIFAALFKLKNHCLNNYTQFPFEDFYLGSLELLTNMHENNEKNGHEVNNPQKLILASKGTYLFGGGTQFPDSMGRTFSFYLYRVILLKVDENRFYNLNDYRLYNRGMNELMGEVKISFPLEKDVWFNTRIMDHEISIPEVLRLQKKYIKDTHKTGWWKKA